MSCRSVFPLGALRQKGHDATSRIAMVHHRVQVDDEIHRRLLDGIVDMTGQRPMEGQPGKHEEEGEMERLEHARPVIESTRRGDGRSMKRIWRHPGSGDPPDLHSTRRDDTAELEYAEPAVQTAIASRLEGTRGVVRAGGTAPRRADRGNAIEESIQPMPAIVGRPGAAPKGCNDVAVNHEPLSPG